ncbi:UPF0149 family protein [Moraxella sp. VT-16-12]|uniref:UPF0149 family protein n=1 Tax=Moraxella sp. VT-16-12 TaxID=2014877 RepID=UPI000B7C937D|nr:UPF0149 family protein [Moraxella sp. VT-16-12]TWV83065.1 UPF0149 family protein [Moraxella sp. VT-16-12]
MSDFLSGWQDWQTAFQDWHDVSISELHGLMSAIMTACQPTDTDGWTLILQELSFDVPNLEALTLLSEYAEDVSFMLKDNDDAYGYEPLVPDDEHELSERFLALKDWAGGFITGLGVAEVALSADENEQVADLAKIASIRPDENDEFDGDEEGYLHLFEFARMVPVLLFRKNRKNIKELSIIKGLSPERLTAQEHQQEKQLPPVFDVMQKQ